jgi:hypothetical protein
MMSKCSPCPSKTGTGGLKGQLTCADRSKTGTRGLKGHNFSTKKARTLDEVSDTCTSIKPRCCSESNDTLVVVDVCCRTRVPFRVSAERDPAT